MIAVQKNSPSLEDVLMAITSKGSPPDATELRELLAEHPEFKREIIDYVTDWVEMEAGSEPEVATQEDVDTVVNHTMSRVQQMLFDAEKAQQLTDLYADIRASGHDADSFRREIGVDSSILDSVAHRLVRPSTIPHRLVAELARALSRPIESLRGFLLLPAIPAGAYKSRKKPQVTQVDFALIVEHSDLSEAEKRRWLDERPDADLRG